MVYGAEEQGPHSQIQFENSFNKKNKNGKLKQSDLPVKRLLMHEDEDEDSDKDAS